MAVAGGGGGTAVDPLVEPAAISGDALGGDGLLAGRAAEQPAAAAIGAMAVVGGAGVAGGAGGVGGVIIIAGISGADISGTGILGAGISCMANIFLTCCNTESTNSIRFVLFIL